MMIIADRVAVGFVPPLYHQLMVPILFGAYADYLAPPLGQLHPNYTRKPAADLPVSLRAP